MTQYFRHALMSVGWQCPVPPWVAPSQPVVVTYHSVPLVRAGTGLDRGAFERHIQFLMKHFEVVPLARTVSGDEPGRRPRVALTFDDGFRNHAEGVAPILRNYGLPATFFVPTRHATPGRYLWFAYLQMLSRYFPGHGFMFRNRFMDMSPGLRRRTMRHIEAELLDLRPHPSAMYQAIDEELPRLEDFVDRTLLEDCCAGAAAAQLQELAADPLFTIGAHTVDHPLLTRCTPDEQFRQMSENKAWIERVCQRPCDVIAYPGSDFDEGVLDQARRAGFAIGFSDHRVMGYDPGLERQRTGIYYPSPSELGFKIRWSRVIAGLRNGRQSSHSGVAKVATVRGTNA